MNLKMIGFTEEELAQCQHISYSSNPANECKYCGYVIIELQEGQEDHCLVQLIQLIQAGTISNDPPRLPTMQVAIEAYIILMNALKLIPVSPKTGDCSDPLWILEHIAREKQEFYGSLGLMPIISMLVYENGGELIVSERKLKNFRTSLQFEGLKSESERILILRSIEMIEEDVFDPTDELLM